MVPCRAIPLEPISAMRSHQRIWISGEQLTGMDTTQSQTVGHLLKRWRIDAGLTQEELAERARLSARTIGNIERGALSKPRADSIRLLSAALELSPQQHATLLAHTRFARVASPLPAGGVGPSGAIPPHYLPVPPTPLLGREREVAEACRLLRSPEVRLLTFVGPPGTGKTRLSLQVAAALTSDFADGVAFVALATITDPAQVLVAVAQTLALRDTDTPLTDALQAHLRERHTLLVLDNFEQVITAGAQLARVLSMCPHLKILATSREALHLLGEHEFPVPPLTLPDPARLPPLDVLESYPAIALFAQRAHAVKPAFALTHNNAREVAEICARLDGLPLAIELAAARIKLLPPAALLARLDQRLLVLAGSHDLPERQYTLHNAISWSHDLLSPPVRQLFRQLSVFAGSWALEAAEVVCQPADGAGSDVLEGLAALMDKSLIRQEEIPNGEVRFGMLETIRAYAFERLRESGEAEALRRRHAEYYLALAETAAPYLSGPEQARWLAGLAPEHDNLRAALNWLRAHARRVTSQSAEQVGGAATALDVTGVIQPDEALELGLRLAGALGPFWSVRGPAREGREQLEELLALAMSSTPDSAAIRVPAATRAKALLEAGRLSEHTGNPHRAERWLEESLRLSREQGDIAQAAAALNRLGILALDAARYCDARVRFEESLRLRRELGDTLGMGSALSNLGVVAMNEGDDERAAAWLEEAIACFEESRPVAASGATSMGLAGALVNLGVLTQRRDDYARSASYLNRALALFRSLNASVGIAVALHHLGNVAREHGEAARARALYAESFALYREYPNMQGVVHCLEDLARLAYAEGHHVRAARLWGAVETMRTAATNLGRPPGELPAYDGDLATLRAALGDEAFARAWARGRTLALEEAIAEAHISMR